MKFNYFFLCSIPVARIKTDVFETLYTKRPSKSSRSSKSSNDSHLGYLDRRNDFARSQNSFDFDSSTYRKPNKKINDVEKFLDAERHPVKPQGYLYGTIERSTPKQKTIPSDCDRNTLINSARSSFRDKFLKSNQPDEKPSYQPLWFIDIRDPVNDNDRVPKSSITRKSTFRIDPNAEKEKSSQTSIGRKNTFRIDRDFRSDRKPNYEPIRVEIQNIGADRTGKIRPVGITAPYSALNDVKVNDQYRSPDRKSCIKVEYNDDRESDRHRHSSISSSTTSISLRDNKSYVNIKTDDTPKVTIRHSDTPNYNTKCLIRLSSVTDSRPNAPAKNKWQPSSTQFVSKPINSVRQKPLNKYTNTNSRSSDWSYNQVYL